MKGFKVLDTMDKVIKIQAKGNLTQLSSEFYTAIPHSFGRWKRPPPINTPELLREKLDMLITLGDIEMAQQMLKAQKTKPNKVIRIRSEVQIFKHRIGVRVF